MKLAHGLFSIALFTLVAPPPSLSAQETSLDQMMANRHAKRVCSGVFLSERDAAVIMRQDHDVDPQTHEIDIDRATGIVSVTTPQGSEGTAVWRAGLGCTIAIDTEPSKLRALDFGRPVPRPLDPQVEWPNGSRTPEKIPPGVDTAALTRALDDAFSEPDKGRRGTRGVAVIQNGHLVAERYAEGFAVDRPIIAWSMTKTVTAALVGMAVGEGLLDIEAPAPVAEWQSDDDPRKSITLDQLLRMSSGLEFSEEYVAGASDVVVMLFAEPDMGTYAANQELETEPDTRWAYSSGTTNIIAEVLVNALGGPEKALTYARRQLFDRIAMAHTVLEPDESGVPVGSSFMYSTPRDMARFGQLLLNDGVWTSASGEESRILPEGWVDYMITPTPANPRGEYGAQTWLNRGEPGNPENRRWPSVPTDAYGLSGFEGQSVTVIPSRNAVIVRMGRSVPRGAFNLDAFLAAVLDALE